MSQLESSASVLRALKQFAVGTTDRRLSLYDFGGLTTGRPFRKITPSPGYWPVAIVFSNSGDRMLVGLNSPQPVVYWREGEQVIQFVRGDMYVTDQAKTSGHTAAVTDVDWHPLKRDVVVTGSTDGSARLWNVVKGKTQFKMLVADKVFSAKNERGQRTGVTVVRFHPGGREVAIGTSCGSVQIWRWDRSSGRPERVAFVLHGKENPVSSLEYNVDGSKLVTRSSADDTMKVWNAQRLSRSAEPLSICADVTSSHDKANVAISPDSNYICATYMFDISRQGTNQVLSTYR